MCGVCGGFRLAGAPEIAPRDLDRMASCLQHRGPDESGQRCLPEGGLAHTRLAILDLTHGRQPIGNEQGTVWVAVNGEIFNHAELRAGLESRGHRFATRTDAEVLVHLYEETGEKLVDELNGQFALAILDQRQGRLLLARDRLGIAPLFYTVARRCLWFASELKALLALPWVSAEPDLIGFNQLFTLWSAQPPHTLFRDLQALPPGHILLADRQGWQTRRYWRLAFPRASDQASPSARATAALAEELRFRLAEAVRLRLQADVPVAVFMSGGLDSSLIAALAKSLVPDLASYSVRFREAEYDEGAYQRIMADFLGTRHHETECRPEDIGRWLPDVIWHAEQPLLRTAPVPLFALARLARQHGCKVVLTGEGADELLGGYDLFREMRIRRFWARRPDSHWRPLLLRRLYRHQPAWPRGVPSYLEAFYRTHLQETSRLSYSHLLRWKTTAWIKPFFSAAWREGMESHDAIADYEAGLPPDFLDYDPLAQAQYIEIDTLLSGHLLSAQGDRMLMAHAVEGRPAFLDHRLVEWCAGLPPAVKIRGLREKVLLKRAAAAIIPPAILERPKQPYRAPHLASLVPGRRSGNAIAELLSRGHLSRQGCFDPVAVQRLVDKCQSSPILAEREQLALTGILTTVLWHDQFIAKRPASTSVPPSRCTGAHP